MAYFSGTATQRPWPRVPVQALLVLLLATSCFAFVLLDLRYGLVSNAQTHTKSKGLLGSSELLPTSLPQKMEIVVPVRTIWPGQQLEPAMFKRSNAEVGESAGQLLTDLESVKGRYAVTLLTEDAPVFEAQIVAASTVNPLTAKIPPGHRAVTIKTDAESGVEGWVRAGSRVDVVWITDHRGKLMITTLVENALAISVNRNVGDLKTAKAQTSLNRTAIEKPRTAASGGYVTLLLSHRDAQKIQLAKRSEGSISLTLRGEHDQDELGNDTMSEKTLLQPDDLLQLEETYGTVKVGTHHYEVRGRSLIPQKVQRGYYR